MRTINTARNIIYSTAGTIITLLLTFISRTVFIQVLGVEYLGIDALFMNILMIFSLAELGIGQAIAFSLYKPLSNSDTEKVNSLMSLYKKIYRYIGFGVLILGIFLLPFLSTLTKSVSDIENLHAIFLIFLLNSSLSYFWGYKRTLIIADQHEYKLVPFTTVSLLVSNLIQISLLILTESYILFLIANLSIKLIENVLINRYIDKKYPLLLKKSLPLSKKDISLITKNVKAMIFHKIGDISVNGTDNIIISTFVSIAAVGVYSNYLMLILIVRRFLMLIFNGITASLGNLIAQESDNRKEEVFRIINFAAFWLFGWATICLYILLSPFITLWIGEDFLVSNLVVLLICIDFFLFGMRTSLGVTKAAGGIYAQDKYAPLIQGGINLGFSLILVQYFGLAGVLMGTVISSILVPFWIRPLVVYKYLFHTSPYKYFVNYIWHTLLIITIGTITYFMVNLNSLQLSWVTLFIDLLICIIVPNILLYIFTHRTFEFNQALKYSLRLKRS